MLVNLTPRFLETGLKCPAGKRRIEFVDKGGVGLYVAVAQTSEGQGTFFLRYKNVDGKTCHQKIGRTTEITLDQARDQAKRLKAEITLGADPQAERKAKQSVPTFDAFFRNQYLPYVKPRKRTWKKDLRMYELRLAKVFGSQRLNQINRQAIQDFHTSCLVDENLAPATCDHFLKLVRQVLNKGCDWGAIEKNPAARVPLFNKDNRVENYLNDQERSRLLTVLRNDANRTVCDIVLMLLLTGARLNEVLQAKWNMINEESRVWRIPASNSKSKRIRSVPLSDEALKLIGRLETRGAHEFLFFNRKTGNPYTTIHKVWERLRNEAGLPKWRLHDCRHEYSSLLISNGRSLFEVQQILGHSSPIVTQRYCHLSAQSLLDAANKAGDIIRDAMQESS